MKAIFRVWFATALLATATRVPAINAGAPPLPTLEDIFKRVMERARREDENERSFNEQFFYVRSRTTEFHNSKGEVKKHDAKTSTNNPAIKVVVLRPVPPPVLPSGTNQPVSDTHSNVRGKAFDKNDFLLNGDLLRRFEFKLAGRETVHGRTALVLDFAPKKNLPERNLKDKFINKAAGRVWVDEGDYALGKVAIRLSERVNVLGGLVGAIWKFTYDFDRERTADGLWFTREANWHLEGREVLFQRTVDYHEERTDVRKAK